MRYEYLLFDADNTLFDFSAAERESITALCRVFGLPFSEENYALYHRCNAELWHDFDKGLCSKEFLLVERFRRYLSLLGLPGDPEALNKKHLQGLASSTAMFPGAVELCRTLSQSHQMYIITNAVESVQRARFARSPVAPFFKDAFISETVGFGKPHVEFFEYVFRAVPGLTRENCLVIGDSLSSDIQGANNAGLPCCWFNPQGAAKPDALRIDYEIRQLNELYSIV